jgi:hypothetical protein
MSEQVQDSGNEVNMEAVIRRIEKLLAIATCETANVHEAASAAQMAEKIMRKYQITHSDVIATALKSGHDMSTVDCMASAKTNGTRVKVVPPWASILASAVADFTDCGARIVQGHDYQAYVRFYGYTPDVTMAKFMFDYLVSTNLRMCNEFKKTPAFLIGGRGELSSYRRGVSVGIIRKINDLIAAKKAEMATVSVSTALVVVKQGAITEKFGNVFSRGKAGSYNVRAGSFSQGVRDGKNVDVARRAVGSTSSPQARLK